MKRFLYTLLALFLFVSMGLTQDTRNIAPREPSGADIGRIDKPWAVGYFDDVVLSNIPLSKLDRTLTLTNMSLQMGYNDSVMVPGEVCGIYHKGKVQVDNVLNLNTNAQDRITYESWKGNVNSITVPHWRPVYNGILNAPLHPFITNGGAYMVMGETNRWITAVDETGVNVSFEPPIPQSDYDYGPDVYIPDYDYGYDIYVVSGYVYRVWTEVGTNEWVSPITTTNAEVLIVGGGGSGGNGLGGGGGAGGLILLHTNIVEGNTYVNYVGAGGASSTNNRRAGFNGENSFWGDIIAYGGGGGGAWDDRNGRSGGSGGGSANTTRSSSTNSQGNPGGIFNGDYRTGGGGGYSQQGEDGIAIAPVRGGNGGDGWDGTEWLCGLSLGDDGWFAGGGGGTDYQSNRIGLGGKGGGGKGSRYTNHDVTAGKPNTGGGGGATGDNNQNSGAGGSGIVILRTLLTEEPPSPLHLSPISPTIASHDTTNFITTFEWESYLPDTTNYLFYLGSTYTNLSQIASTTNTSLTVNLLDYTDYVNQTTFWKVEAQAVPGVATGEVWYFYQHLNFIYPIDDVRGVELREDGLYGGYLTFDYATPQPLTSAGSRNWRGVSSHDGVTVYGAADNNYIHKSTDGGETWTALTSAGSRNWQGVSSHDGVTVYGAVDNNYIHKSIGWIDNSLLNKSYTIIIQPTTNAINKLQDIHIGENNNFIYYMLNTKTNEWSIYDTYHKWRTVVSKIGDDWYYRNTNNVMEPSYTNEISTISMAINNNRYNRQRYFAYSGYLDYEHVEPLRISATFYNQATNQAPVLNAINLSTLSYPNEYKSNLSNYEITINSANSTNSIVKKLSPGTNNVIISYYQMLKDTE